MALPLRLMRYKLLIEYDGSRFAGWQLQKNDRSIQGELIAAATALFGNPPLELYGSGRTDAGVHARGQVAHLEIRGESRLRTDQIQMGLNDHLPHDINVLLVAKAAPRFHARFDAKERIYVYQISKRRDAFGKKHVWWVRDHLDVAAMKSAAALLVGFHNFRSFGSVPDPTQSTMVEMNRVEITEDADRIYITISASHFLWKMVRRMVGVLVEVGRKNLSNADILRFLEQPSPEPARLTAPPSGLFLEEVKY